MSHPVIAITGMAVRVAGASDVEAFWTNLLTGSDPFSPLPRIRFDPEVFRGELPAARGPVLGALVEDFSLDWRTLRMPPSQVEHLHHGERLALAVVGAALGDAGLRHGTEPLDKASIWIAANGFGPDPWLDPSPRIRRFELAASLHEALEQVVPARSMQIGAIIDRAADLAAPPLEPDVLMVSPCITAGRASQLYDLRGGHLAIDSGTCSSMAAVDQAVLSLRNGEIDIALVCASAPLITPSAVLSFAHRGDLALDRPRPFMPDATGTLLGEGALAIVLERQEHVVGRRIYALIEAISSAFCPGASEAEAIERCVGNAATKALDEAGVRPDQVNLIESRAAGIMLLDRAEARGLARAYSQRMTPALLTSSVPVVGFLQAASGLLAIAKGALAIRHRCWPAQGGLHTSFDPVAGLRVPAILESWSGPRYVAVSDAGSERAAYHAILSDPTYAKPRVASCGPGSSNSEPIAIVGAGVVAPGVDSVEAFWRDALACEARLADLPHSRWDVDRLTGTNTELRQAFRTRLACTVRLPSLDSPRYSALLSGGRGTADPATILAVAVTEQALRDANLTLDAPENPRIGVVFGQVALRGIELMTERRVQYALLAALAGDAMREAGLDEPRVQAVLAEAQSRFDRENQKISSATLDHFSGIRLARDTAAAFGLTGGMLSVDGACASSLAAVKVATAALREGRVDAVLAGGVSYHLFPEYYIGLGLLDALSTRAGRPFHRDADGFVPAEAAGAVLLKRLSDAQRDGNRVYAVITGHGIASDGRGLSIYSSNPAGQQLAMTRALDAAGVAPADIDLIEAHGPGAPVGDRAEIVSIAGVYAKRPYLPPLAIASAKSLVGHSSSAGAMLSLIRAAMALDSKTLPPSAGNGELAPDLPFGSTLELSRVSRPWVALPGRPRRAAVNSFGMTGVDHHVVLEETTLEGCRNDIQRTELGRPASKPGTPLSADRFILTASPVSLPSRAPLLPLRGKTLLLIAPPTNLVATELHRHLSARGAHIAVLSSDQRRFENDLHARTEAELSSIDGVIDLSSLEPLGDPTSLSGAELWPRLKAYSDRTFALLRILYERFAQPSIAPRCYAAITSVTSSTEQLGNPLGAFFQGFARALKQELPGLVCKAVDLDPRCSSTEAAAFIVQELEDGNDRVDVRYCNRQRYVTSFQRADFTDTTPLLRPVQPGNVFLFSGGGRGVVHQCAAALARRGLHVIVTGRRALPDPSLDWVRMTDAEFAEFRRTELARRRGTEGPAQIIRALDDLDFQRQAFSNIAAARAAGLSLEYEICDINEARSVADLATRVRARFGRIDGVGHGAMVEHSATIPRKSAGTIDATLSTKVTGLLNLVNATRQDRLKWFVAFGSGVGRYGNSGQTDYAASNAIVAALLSAHARTTLSATHCVTIDWPAWQSLGATSNRDIAQLLLDAGVTSISPEEGIYWFLSELALGDAPEVVLCGERMLQNWPFLTHEADGKASRAIELDDDGKPMTPSRWPMVDRVVDKTDERTVFERVISVDRDLYMPQHLLNGLPVLPATFGCEILAESAAIACPGLNVREVRDFHVEAALGLPRSSPVTTRVVVRTQRDTDEERDVLAELHTSPGSRSRALGERLHHSAHLTLTRSPPAPLGTYEVPRRSEVVRSTSLYTSLLDTVQLGQLFSIARWIQVFGNEAIGTIEPPSLGDTFADVTSPRFIVHPLVLDAALQIAGTWDGLREGHISVPIGIDSLVLGRPLAQGERAQAHARVRRIDQRDVYYDITVVGDRAEIVMNLSGVHLRRVSSRSSPP